MPLLLLFQHLAEEHRALVRRQLRALLAEGHNPLDLFAKDLRAYFYVGECLSMVVSVSESASGQAKADRVYKALVCGRRT